MKNLKTCRTARGMTQAQCASAVGISLSTWAKWERGAIDVKSATQNTIADLFGVTLDQLHGRAEFTPTPVTPSEVA